MMAKFCLSICLLVFSNMGFAEQQTWYLVRHFEKQLAADPSLTETGKARAQALAEFFADKPLQRIFSTNYKRTMQTADPVAAQKALPIQSYDPNELAGFAELVSHLNHVLVVGHSNTTPELLSLLGGAKITMSELDYGTVYVLHKENGVFQTHTQTIHLP